MFYFNFRIKNPFKTKDFNQIDYIEYDKKLTKNKCLEIQFTRWRADTIFGFDVDAQWIGISHGGLGFSIDLLGYFFNIKIYDHRHWDYDNHCWEKYDES